MGTLVIALASILVLTGLAWLASKATQRIAICPVCVGVSGTWLGLLAARFAGVTVDSAVLGLLLGATVLGIVQWTADRLPAGRSVPAWKALGLAAGTVAAYGLIVEHWFLAGAGLFAFVCLAAIFRMRAETRAPSSEAVTRLEEKMKRCC